MDDREIQVQHFLKLSTAETIVFLVNQQLQNIVGLVQYPKPTA